MNLVALVVAGGGRGDPCSRRRLPSPLGSGFPGYFGFICSFSRDLSEPVAGALALAAILALRRGRWLGAGLLFGAALSRETTLVFVAGWAFSRVANVVRGRARMGPPDIAWVVPLSAFGLWQANDDPGHRRDATHRRQRQQCRPAIRGPGARLKALVGLHSHQSDLAQIAVLAVVLLAAATAFRSTALPVAERIMWGVAVIAAACPAKIVWVGFDDLRAFAELWILSVLVLLSCRHRRQLAGVLAGGSWAVAALSTSSVL